MKSYLLRALLPLLLVGCSSVPSVSTYRIDVQQGNAVTQDMVARIRPGMTRAQVRFALGTPLLNDIFHNDRWDYVYTYAKSGEVVERRRLILFFEGDTLKRMEGEALPSRLAPPAVVPAAEPKPAAPADAAAAPAPAVPVESAPAVEPPAGAAKDGPGAAAGENAPSGKPAEEKGFFGRMLESIGL